MLMLHTTSMTSPSSLLYFLGLKTLFPLFIPPPAHRLAYFKETTPTPPTTFPPQDKAHDLTMFSNSTPQPTKAAKGKGKVRPAIRTGPGSVHYSFLHSDDPSGGKNKTRTMPKDDENGESSFAAKKDSLQEEVQRELEGYHYMLEYLEVRVKEEEEEERERLKQKQQKLQQQEQQEQSD